MEEAFLTNLLKPLFIAVCLAIGFPVIYYVRNKLRDGRLKKLLLTDLDPWETAREKKREEARRKRKLARAERKVPTE